VTKGTKWWILLLLGGSLWTAVAAVAVVAILLRAPLVFEVSGSPLFLSSPGLVVALWAFGLGALIASPMRSRRVRRGLWIVWWLCLAISVVWVIDQLSPAKPENEASAAGEVLPGQRRTTLLIAVDGMSWTAILPMARRGELPNISRLMDEGSYGVLHSIRTYRKSVDRWGYWSPVVWTSVATGVRPRRHGITDFVLADGPSRGGMAASTHRRAPAFWNLFSAFGQRVGVVGWWATWPAESVSGYLVSSHVGLGGWRTGELGLAGLTFPEELADELGLRNDAPGRVEEWVNREVFPFELYPVLTESELETMYSVLWQDRIYLDTLRYLVEERDPVDLYCVYFKGIDALSHHFWKGFIDPDDVDAITLPQGFRDHTRIVPTYYRIIDSYLGELLQTLPETTTVVLVSDHGFRLDAGNMKGATHSPYGVLIARGEGIQEGRSINLDPVGSFREALHGTTDVLDVLPTLLYLHGLPIARDLEGEILGDLLTPRFLERQSVLWVDSYGDFSKERPVDVVLDPEVSKEYEERLRSLGYIQ